MRSLQYVSDIHLETRSGFLKIPIKSNNLALLGDIGDPFKPNYRDFLQYCSYNFENVFLIAGNHEFWHHKQPHQKVVDQISNLAAKSNVKFLNDSEAKLYDYTILGSTLWTPFTYSIYHKKCVSYLEKRIEDKDKVIVLSHYLPSFKLITSEYQTEEWLKFHKNYASDLEYLIRNPIYAWLCGHSHCIYETNINGVSCRINAVGYSNEVKGRVLEMI